MAISSPAPCELADLRPPPRGFRVSKQTGVVCGVNFCGEPWLGRLTFTFTACDVGFLPVTQETKRKARTVAAAARRPRQRKAAADARPGGEGAKSVRYSEAMYRGSGAPRREAS